MKVDALIDTIKRSIATGASKPVRIVERTLLLDLIKFDKESQEKYNPRPQFIPNKDEGGKFKWRNLGANVRAYMNWIFKSPFFNFFVIVSALLAFAVSIFAMITFFINDVLIQNPENTVNDRGSLVFNQPLAKEHYMYLVNTSELWPDSGIEVLPGDKIKMSVSGAYYSDIVELYDSAKKNKTLKYSYYSHRYDSADSNDYSAFSILPDEPYGILLYRVQSPGRTYSHDYVSPDSMSYGSFPNGYGKKVEFTSKNYGTLHFAVNDILLSDTTRINSILHTSEKNKDGVMDSVMANALKNAWNENAAMTERRWFDDNCGEFLINVEVERKVFGNKEVPWYNKLLVIGMRSLAWVLVGFAMLIILIGLSNIQKSKK